MGEISEMREQAPERGTTSSPLTTSAQLAAPGRHPGLSAVLHQDGDMLVRGPQRDIDALRHHDSDARHRAPAARADEAAA